MVGLPDDTEAMIPIPIAMTAPMNTQIGATRASTPLCHRANPTPKMRTKYPMRNMVMNFMPVPCENCSNCSARGFGACDCGAAGGPAGGDILGIGVGDAGVEPLTTIGSA